MEHAGETSWNILEKLHGINWRNFKEHTGETSWNILEKLQGTYRRNIMEKFQELTGKLG
jgi:hypothetical protein